MENVKLLEEIKKDFVEKFDNDPQINRICTVIINEFKIRKQGLKVLNFLEDSPTSEIKYAGDAAEESKNVFKMTLEKIEGEIVIKEGVYCEN